MSQQLNSYFAGRTAGDAISIEFGDGQTDELLYIRDTASGGMLLAKVCDCGTHIDGFVAGSVSWSPEQGALLMKGVVPSWWKGAKVIYTPGKYPEMALQNRDVPMPEDTTELTSADLGRIAESMGEKFENAALRFLNGQNDMQATRLLLADIGVTMSDEQFDQMRTVLYQVESGRRARSVVQGVFAGGLGEAIAQMMGGSKRGFRQQRH